MTNQANDNQPLAVGDRVRRRDIPYLTGTVWELETRLHPDTIMVDWDDGEECATVAARYVERIIPETPPVAALRLVPPRQE
jgi:hypothetical protein